nr:protein ripply2 [Nothobranchius furzeri]
MENKPSSGPQPGSDGDNPTQERSFWRPWNKNADLPNNHPSHALREDLNTQHKIQQVIHPVKLFWPKSRCFDYLYRDAEKLLRNYPFQATICPYEDSSSDEEDEDGDEEEPETKKN